MDGITEPVSPGLARILRRAVLDHVRGERRRSFSPVVHVGVPGRVEARLDLAGARFDHALRVDCLEALVRRVESARRTPPETRTVTGTPPALLVWLTRPGPAETQDVDLDWSAAAATAAAELGRRLPMVVVDRQGWRDVRTGTGRTWRRIRDRTGSASGGP